MMQLRAIDDCAETGRDDDAVPDYDDALARILDGTVSGLASLFDAEAPRMLAIARRMGHSQPGAEQIVRNCFVDIWRRAKRLSGRETIRAWLFATFREETRRAQSLLPQTQSHIDTYDDTSELFAKLPANSALRNALEPLGVGREIILLAYLDGLTYTALAARSGFVLTKIRVLLRGALGALSVLTESGDYPEHAILAGEYATGLLDAADRIAVDELRARDANAENAIQAWQALLVECNDLPDPVAPNAHTWRAIARLVEAAPRYRASGLSANALLRAQNKAQKPRHSALLSCLAIGVVFAVGIWVFAAASVVEAEPAGQTVGVPPPPVTIVERDTRPPKDASAMLAVRGRQVRDALAFNENRLKGLVSEVALLAARRDGLAFSVANLEAELARAEEMRATQQAYDAESVTSALELTETVSRPSTKVFMHHVVGDSAYERRTHELAQDLRSETFNVVDVSAVDFRVDKTAVRFFFAQDAERAAALLERIRALNRETGVPLMDTAQDFTEFRPLPEPGTVEVWLGAPR